MKKILFVWIAFTGFCAASFAAEFTDGGIKYDTTSPTTVKVIANAYTGNITIPSTVTYNSVTYSVTAIGDSAFYNRTGLTSITIPNSVTSIGNAAFAYCSGLTGALTLPSGLTSIGTSAFRVCGFTSVSFPSGLTSIQGSAFYGCSGLTSVSFPSSLTSIGNYAFGYCSGLTEITNLKSVPISITVSAFAGVNQAACVLKVLAASLALYQSAAYWQDFDIKGNYVVSVTVNNTLYGSTSGDGLYENNDQAMLTATANTGYTFSDWTSNGIVLSTANSFAFTVISDTTIVANFVLDTFTVSVAANNASYGSVSGGANYPYLEQASLTATANTNYAFENWTSNGVVVSTVNPFTFTVISDTSIIANFVPDTFTVSVAANNASYGSVSGGADYPYLEQATLTGTANAGYAFENWTSNGVVISTTNPFVFTVTSDTNMVANFVQTFTVSVSANYASYGSVSGGGIYNANDQATLTATANTNYAFENWTCNGVVVSTDNPFVFTVIGDTNIVANFKSTIGISEATTQSGIVLYPNPVKDVLHIQSSATIEQATIYDLSGRIVRQVQMTNDISVQDLAKGVYVIKIETKKGLEVRKIVKE